MLANIIYFIRSVDVIGGKNPATTQNFRHISLYSDLEKKYYY